MCALIDTTMTDPEISQHPIRRARLEAMRMNAYKKIMGFTIDEYSNPVPKHGSYQSFCEQHPLSEYEHI